MLTLKLFPAEFRSLIGYLRYHTVGQDQVPLVQQQVSLRIMADYVRRISLVRIEAWKNRPNLKDYSLRIPVTIGLAIYQHMQTAELGEHQLVLLAKLDQAIINYRPPHHEFHSVGELMQFTHVYSNPNHN